MLVSCSPANKSETLSKSQVIHNNRICHKRKRISALGQQLKLSNNFQDVTFDESNELKNLHPLLEVLHNVDQIRHLLVSNAELEASQILRRKQDSMGITPDSESSEAEELESPEAQHFPRRSGGVNHTPGELRKLQSVLSIEIPALSGPICRHRRNAVYWLRHFVAKWTHLRKSGHELWCPLNRPKPS